MLSQYQTAVNNSGCLPPQESGLVANSWQGKFHLEMHWWHAAHFAAWGRPELLVRSMDWLSVHTRATARRQSYEGARWPKHVGPDGRESPSDIGALLVWQQPHPLYLLELLHRTLQEDRRSELVTRFAEVVEETARFMVSFVEERSGTYIARARDARAGVLRREEHRGPHVRTRLLVARVGDRPVVARAPGPGA